MIQQGDKCILWRISEDGQILCSSKVVVLNMPRGEGDLLQVQHEGGGIEALNPYGKFFDSIVKEPTTKKNSSA